MVGSDPHARHSVADHPQGQRVMAPCGRRGTAGAQELWKALPQLGPGARHSPRPGSPPMSQLWWMDGRPMAEAPCRHYPFLDMLRCRGQVGLVPGRPT